jgi:transposase
MIRRIRELTRTIDALQDELATLVAQTAPQLLAETGIGVLPAAKCIGEIAGIDCFSSDAQLARMAGCAPIPASSGRTDRHRLDLGAADAAESFVGSSGPAHQMQRSRGCLA